MNEMNSPLVSIIMPAYNAGKTIENSVESVINQTFQEWELIIINDCSTDNTEVLVNSFSDKDNRIKLINHEVNKRVAEARNTGVNNSKGKYIAFLDSDDMWTPEKLETQINLMELHNYKFTYSNTIVINEDGVIKGVRVEPVKMNYKDLLKSNHIACLTVVLDSNIAKKYPMKTIGHEDYLTWLEITKSGITAYNTNELHGYYRVADGSLSSNKVKAAKWQWNIYRKSLGLNIFESLRYFISYLYYGIKKTR